jgi:divalent metal cation (Fe/Co/Zn/Cd) transporter
VVSTAPEARGTIRSDHLERERSLRFAITVDALLITAMLLSSVAGRSLTMFAESVRAVLMLSTEVFAFVAIRRIHRGQFLGFDFGVGKIEQLANLAITGGMLGSAAWIAIGAVRQLFIVREPGSPAGLAFVAIVGAINTYFNWVSWLAVRQATPPGSPVIMLAQLRSRSVKLASSCFVLLLLTIAAVFTDPGIVLLTDVSGALFVAGFLVRTAREMWRDGLPDLIDRSVDESVQRPITRALVEQFDAYDYLGAVRTRRSGKTVFIELTLGFFPDRSGSEIEERRAAVKAALHREVAHADVAIITGVTPVLGTRGGDA